MKTNSNTRRFLRRTAAAAATALACVAAQAAGPLGTTFPPDFAAPEDASLGVPVIGAAGAVKRTPVIFLHGNGGTPYDTGCSRWSANMQGFAQFFSDSGYAPSELWGLGYQGTQCDLIDRPGNMASLAHSHAANVPDLRKFVAAVLAYTGAARVDIVAHGMGVTLAREWMRQDGDRAVRRMVAIEGPNGGTIVCAADARNPWALAFNGGYTPTSAVCQELGSPNTSFLTLLNRNRFTRNRIADTKGVETLVVRNIDTSFAYIPAPDGIFSAVAAVDYNGQATDFSSSARVPRATAEITMTGQGAYDLMGTAHLGIANSPQTWQAALSFLTRVR
jgi:pimeloyl-ACP methyl ester carboxylesterase